MRRERGFVLVNALILVAALSAVAVYLLSRAEGSRLRLTAAQLATSLTLGLDAVEALAITRLDADMAEGGTDHPGEAWATPQSGLPLALGTASIRLSDAQGRFNLNWLAVRENERAAEAFHRLARGLGLSPRAADAVIDFLKPGGPDDRAGYASLIPPLDPVGGAILMPEQIAESPALDAAAYARLAPYISAIPGNARLNVNTVSTEVLSAFLPGVPAARLSRALARRNQDPFGSTDDFLVALGGLTPAGEDRDGDGEPDETEALIGRDELTVSSMWFVVQAQVDLDGRRAMRVALIERRSLSEGGRIAWRLDAPR